MKDIMIRSIEQLNGRPKKIRVIRNVRHYELRGAVHWFFTTTGIVKRRTDTWVVG